MKRTNDYIADNLNISYTPMRISPKKSGFMSNKSASK